MDKFIVENEFDSIRLDAYLAKKALILSNSS